MKRSHVNECIAKAMAFAGKLNFKLPPFAFWGVEDWQSKGCDYDEIRDLRLGWDVTDFGMGDYFKVGRTLFTLRNGNDNFPQYRRRYSEKFIFLEEQQPAPIHYHRTKTEDVINRGGGNVIVQVSKATSEGKKSDESFTMSVNGCREEFMAGGTRRLGPGESILVPAGIIHEFWSEKGTGMTLSGEIATICDDINDNMFLVDCERFVEIEEDEKISHYLCNEYPEAIKS